MEYGKIHAPKEFTTTMQSIINTVYSAAGVGIGSLLGGYVMDEYGGQCYDVYVTGGQCSCG